jgi:NADPH-dependent curcumin reductase CurA
MNALNRQWRLVRRPVGLVDANDIKFGEAEIPEVHENEFLVQNLLISLDPTQRLWISGKETYFPPMPVGDVMWAGSVGVVKSSRHKDFPVGAHVSSFSFGMQDYCVSNGEGVSVIPPFVPLDAWFAVFGHIGITAYFGLLDIGQPKAGDTLVVSGAAGAVGSLVGQIGRIKGCRVVGIAGTAEKCEWLKKDLGFDATINYKTENVALRLKETCPKGIDIYFDNVGGEILDAALANLSIGARIPMCGMISQYNKAEWSGPTNMMELVNKRARMQGFLVLDYLPRAEEAMTQLGGWLNEGKIKYRVEIVSGLASAMTAFNRLFDGANQGKLVVDLRNDSH